jgi:2-polyprenyl-6-hydroxyphenyl methylase/3-demethylubiquinone-9 3-methyltransferase
MISTHEAEVARRFDALRGRFGSTLADDDYRLRGLYKALGTFHGLLILDLGCGKGRFARAIQARGCRVVGLDISTAMLVEADGVPRVRATARRLPFSRGSFDGIIAVEMFEHLEPRSRGIVLDEARRVLCPGGFLAILDKNVGSLSAKRPWLPSALVKRIDEYRGRWMYPSYGPVRERWFWPAGLKRELRRRFEDVVVARLLSPVEERSWLFRRLPAARLMTVWVARAPGGPHV